jgi:hypothetical protein
VAQLTAMMSERFQASGRGRGGAGAGRSGGSGRSRPGVTARSHAVAHSRSPADELVASLPAERIARSGRVTAKFECTLNKVKLNPGRPSRPAIPLSAARAPYHRSPRPGSTGMPAHPSSNRIAAAQIAETTATIMRTRAHTSIARAASPLAQKTSTHSGTALAESTFT